MRAAARRRAMKKGFGSYEQFESEMLKHRSGPMSSFVDEIAEEMYHTEVQEEFDTLWDKAADDD
jgi:hypothetical protein